MPSWTPPKDAAGRAGTGDRRGALLWPAGLVILLVEVLVVPAAASPFRVPKMAVALAGLCLTLVLPAALALWAGTIPRIRSRMVWPILALPALQALSIAWATDRSMAAATTATTTVWCATILLLALMGQEAIARLALWAAIGAALSAATGLLQLLRLPLLAVEDHGGRMAITGLTGNPADLAMTSLLILPFVLFATGLGRERPRLRLVLGGILLAAAVSTQTLTALAAAGLVVVFWLYRLRSRRVSLAVVLLTIAVIASSILGGVPHRLAGALHQVVTGDWYQLLSARADGWTAALEMVEERPLTGVGAGCFGHRFYPARLAWLERHDSHGARGETSTHFQWAHSDPLQLLAELGLSGLLWLGVMLVLFLPKVRGDPLATAGLLTASPFLLLHYPAHLAVGLVPLALLTAHLLAGEPVESPARPPAWQRPAAVAAVAAVLAVGWWQAGILRSELWRGSLERVLRQAVTLPAPNRQRAMQAVAGSIERRLAARPSEDRWLNEDLGKALLVAGDSTGAEQAFRRSFRRWPRAETELGLGMALAAQGRTPEALEHLARAGRVNPKLLETLGDPELRRAARNLATGP